MQSPHGNVISALKSSGLWGTIVPNVFKPSVFLQIQFKDATVELGNSIEVEKAQDEPKVGFVSNEPTNEKQDDHLLLLIDPDAPSRNDPKWGPFLHWIQPGLKPLSIDEIASVADTGEGAKEGGDDAVWVKKNEKAKVDYLGPAPPEGTGPHRYVYLLYRQPQTEISLPKDCPSEIKEMGDRKQFDFESFVELNKLELVGVNFHTSEAK